MEPASQDTFEDLTTRIVDVFNRKHGGYFLLSNLICRLELLNPWKASMPSCAHWLVWRCGFDMVTAREKVRAITQGAQPDAEQSWVEAGLENTAAQL